VLTAGEVNLLESSQAGEEFERWGAQGLGSPPDKAMAELTVASERHHA